jgi:glyoxylase I family protein
MGFPKSVPSGRQDSAFANMKGHHVAVRVPDFERAKRWYVDKLDFRVVYEWPYTDQRLAYLAPANDDHFWVELLLRRAPTRAQDPIHGPW